MIYLDRACSGSHRVSLRQAFSCSPRATLPSRRYSDWADIEAARSSNVFIRSATCSRPSGSSGASGAGRARSTVPAARPPARAHSPAGTSSPRSASKGLRGSAAIRSERLSTRSVGRGRAPATIGHRLAAGVHRCRQRSRRRHSAEPETAEISPLRFNGTQNRLLIELDRNERILVGEAAAETSKTNSRARSKSISFCRHRQPVRPPSRDNLASRSKSDFLVIECCESSQPG